MSSLDNSNGSVPPPAEVVSENSQKASNNKVAKPAKPAKPTSERMAESVHLVKQLADVGIGKTHPHMIALREILNKWIRDPEYSYNGRVDFDAYGRRGDLILPRVPGHVASIRLRAI
jgi:hypothetical protein